MFNFGEITHIIKNPAGTFSYVGSVPLTLMLKREPTRADIMGGRVQDDGFAYIGKAIATIEQAVNEAKEAGAQLCDSKTCACRKLF